MKSNSEHVKVAVTKEIYSHTLNLVKELKKHYPDLTSNETFEIQLFGFQIEMVVSENADSVFDMI
jgi:hypothetical protein